MFLPKLMKEKNVVIKNLGFPTMTFFFCLILEKSRGMRLSLKCSTFTNIGHIFFYCIKSKAYIFMDITFK